jgi:hypothetical protein
MKRKMVMLSVTYFILQTVSEDTRLTRTEPLRIVTYYV